MGAESSEHAATAGFSSLLTMLLSTCTAIAQMHSNSPFALRALHDACPCVARKIRHVIPSWQHIDMRDPPAQA